MKLERISQLQLFMVFVIFIDVSVLHGPIIDAAGYSGWLALCIGSIGGLAIACLAVSFARKRPKEFFVLYGREVIGKWLHIPFIMLAIFFFLQVGAIQLRHFQDFFLLYFLPNTPDWVFSVLFGICPALAVRSGMEAIVRCAQGFFFIIYLILLSVPFLVGKEIKREMAIAFLTHVDQKALAGAIFGIIPWYGLMMMVLFFFPFIADHRKTNPTLGWAVLFISFLKILYLIIIILLFGPTLAGNLSNPAIQVFRYIRIADFLENLDPFIMAVWVTSVFVSVSLSLYVAVLCTAQTFSLKDYRPLSLSMSAIMIGLSFHIVDNKAEFPQYIQQWFTPFALFIECMPVVYWIVDGIRSKIR